MIYPDRDNLLSEVLSTDELTLTNADQRDKEKHFQDFNEELMYHYQVNPSAVALERKRWKLHPWYETHIRVSIQNQIFEPRQLRMSSYLQHVQ